VRSSSACNACAARFVWARGPLLFYGGSFMTPGLELFHGPGRSCSTAGRSRTLPRRSRITCRWCDARAVTDTCLLIDRYAYDYGGKTVPPLVRPSMQLKLDRRGTNLPRMKRAITMMVASWVFAVFCAGAFGAPHFRSCGSSSGMAPNSVWATPNVACGQARRLMHELLGGSRACYPNGPSVHPHCKLDGFACSAHPTATGSRGNCVNHRRWITGVIYGP